MKTTEFNKPMSSAKLKEHLSKQFNTNVDIEQYGREKLEDMRNKLRTRIFQHEGSAGFNDLLTNETYQKEKAMLELLNTRIKEMLGEQMKQLRDKIDALNEAKKGTRPPKTKISAKGSKPDFLDMDKDGDKKEPMKKAVADKKKNPFAKVKEGAKPDFLDMDKDGNKKEPMKKAIKDKKATEAAEKTPSTWTDSKGNKHPATKVKGDKYTGKEAEKDVKEEMKVGDKKKSSTGGTIEKTKTGVKHTAGNNYGAQKQPFNKNSKDLDEGKHDSDCDCNECSTMEGKDEGKPGKNFAKIAKSAGKEYGSKAAGERVAGAVRAKLAKQGKLEESNFKHNVRFVNESLAFLINEDEEGKAKAITAAGDMVNDYTSWMQRVGQYQTKTMIELADAIKADFGAAEAEAFKQAVGPALSATLEVLTQQREAVSNAVAVLAGEAAPEAPMGAEPGMEPGMDTGMDMTAPDEMNPPAGDEFGASDAAAGGAETAGRAMREGKDQRRARKLAEAHSIMSKLSK